jgi:rSAM/selenodomain-associated transferase 2
MLVSIVIPARRGEERLPQLLQQLPPALSDVEGPEPDAEVIVAFGGPLDDDARCVRQAHRDVVWVESEEGRGPQLNAGASRALGEWIWFVHADSRLPPDWIEVFRALASSPSVVGGSFAFQLDSEAWQARVLERGVAMRVALFGLPYGDQGIFVRRAVFQKMGGYAAIPLMEDVDFVRRLKREGRLRHLNVKLATSARRWERDGWWLRSALNLVFLTLYKLGASPAWLAKRYHRNYADQEKA